PGDLQNTWAQEITSSPVILSGACFGWGERILTRQIGNSKCCTMSRIYGAVLSFVQDLWTAVKVTVRRRPGFAADTGVSRDALEHFCSLARGRGICHFQTVCQLEDF